MTATGLDNHRRSGVGMLGRGESDGASERHRPVLGVVLAAGQGTRFGGPKVLADSGDWLRSAVAALADGGCDHVVVTLGAAQVPVPAPARAITVARWRDGLAESVRAGLREALSNPETAGVLLHVVDTPETGPDVVDRVLGASDRQPAALVRAVFGSRPGHPVYLGVDHVPAVLAAIGGDHGAGDYLASRADVIEVQCADLASGIDRGVHSSESPPDLPLQRTTLYFSPVRTEHCEGGGTR